MRLSSKGFSLVELLVVVVIIGILVAIAYPSYQKYVIRTKRVDVQTQMMQISQKLQSYRVINHSYKDVTLADLGFSPNYAEYALELVIGDGNQSWTLSAEPTGAISQNGTVFLDHWGHKCWQKSQSTCTLSATSTWDE